jgi:cell division protein FtsB
MKLRTLTVTTALSVFALGAFAQAGGPAATPRVDARQANQDKRIDQGIASGELTKRETKKLEGEQNRIDRVEDRAKADGTVTKKERAHLAHLQNKASRDIARQKHDAQEKPRAP